MRQPERPTANYGMLKVCLLRQPPPCVFGLGPPFCRASPSLSLPLMDTNEFYHFNIVHSLSLGLCSCVRGAGKRDHNLRMGPHLRGTETKEGRENILGG